MKNVFALQDGVTTPEKGRELPIKARNFAFQDPPARCPLPPFFAFGIPSNCSLPVDSGEQRN